MDLAKGRIIHTLDNKYWVLVNDISYTPEMFYAPTLVEKVLCVTLEEGYPRCEMLRTHVANIHYFIVSLIGGVKAEHSQVMQNVFEHLDEYIFEAALLDLG